MDTTTATDLANNVFAQIQALINQGQAEALANSTSQNSSTSDSSSSGVPGNAQNAFAQIQQSFATAQAQVLADLSSSQGNTSTDSSAATTSTDSSAATTSTDSSAATASTTTSTDSSTATASTTATPSVQEQLTQVGQSQVTADLANDSLTNPGSDNSSTSSDAFNVQYVPGESGSGGQVNGSFADGQPAFSFILGASGPVISSGDGQGASANTLSSIAPQGDIANYVASLIGLTPTA